MEVHHHSHHPKKWKEYISEFLMLFLAVSLGFMAENILEHQIEKHREISYLKNVHDDLQLDIKEIEKIINQNNVRLQVLDTLFSVMKNKSIKNEDFYYYSRNLSLRSTFESSHIGLDQIKSAGGLRMIKNKDIIFGIQNYERTLNTMEKLESVRERTLEQARFKMSVVFDPATNYEMVLYQVDTSVESIMRFKRPQKADAILQKNQASLDELLNLLIIGLNTNKYLNRYLSNLKKIGENLDRVILKEYEAKFD